MILRKILGPLIGAVIGFGLGYLSHCIGSKG